MRQQLKQNVHVVPTDSRLENGTDDGIHDVLHHGSPCSQVRQQLQQSIYFVPADRRFENGVPEGDSPKWTLAVLRPIRWRLSIIFSAPVLMFGPETE